MSGVVIVISSGVAWAQILPDRTLGSEQPLVRFDATLEATLIQGGANRQPNLFHSFQQFNVSSGQRVLFDNPSDVQRILSRVTGGNVSQILGVLGVWNSQAQQRGNADLFFINPNGIIFGPHATLDLNGSFVASTATSLRFADGTYFSVTDETVKPLLTVTAPNGLLFGDATGNIHINGTQLQISSDHTLALIGGDLSFQATSRSLPIFLFLDGRVELGSVDDGSFVALMSSPDTGLTFDYEGVQQFRDIQLESFSLATFDASLQAIQVQGRAVTLLNGAQLGTTSAFGVQPGGSITVSASESVDLLGTDLQGSGSGLVTVTFGSAGNITIQTKRLSLRDGAGILTVSISPFDAGQSGNLSVNASESVELVGQNTALTTQTLGANAAGDLTIQTNRLSIQDGAFITAETQSQGAGGTITIQGPSSVAVTGPGSGILSIATFGPGNIPASGPGGTIRIVDVGVVTVTNGARIGTSSVGTGAGGNIEFDQVNAVILDQGSISAEANSNGGNITIQGSPVVLLDNNSAISAAVEGDGDGGNIDLNASVIAAVPGSDSDITANAGLGMGGNITLTAQGVFGLEERNAIEGNGTNDIDASSDFGLDGTVTLNTPETDPNQALVTLPMAVADLQLAQNCAPVTPEVAGRFVNTGRGGLPADHSPVLSSGAVWEDLRSPSLVSTSSTPAQQAEDISHPPTPQIIEAQGWVTSTKGKIFLTAQVPTATPYSSQQSVGTC
jgi:filamentous hemagglutinin family protein